MEEEEEKEKLRQNKDEGSRRNKDGRIEKGGIYLERLRRVGRAEENGRMQKM